MLTLEQNSNISLLGMRNKALTLVNDMSYTRPGTTDMPRCNSPLSYAVWKCNQLPGLHCKWTHIRCMFSLANEIKFEILGFETKGLRVKTWGIYLCHLWRHNWGVDGRGRIEHLHIDTISTFRMRHWNVQKISCEKWDHQPCTLTLPSLACKLTCAQYIPLWYEMSSFTLT